VQAGGLTCGADGWLRACRLRACRTPDVADVSDAADARQMYIDGYVPDYYYTYKARYAPDARAIIDWIEREVPPCPPPTPYQQPASASCAVMKPKSNHRSSTRFRTWSSRSRRSQR